MQRLVIFMFLLIAAFRVSAEEPTYIAKFGSPDAKERMDAVKAARRGLSPKFNEQTRQLISASDEKYRPQIKAALIKLLEDADAEVQGTSLETLTIMFGEEVIDLEEKILGMTASKNGVLRRSALKYFEQLHFFTTPKTPRAKLGEMFFAALSDPESEIRADATIAIQPYRGGDEKLVATLTNLLKDADANVRGMATYALAHCPDLPAETMIAIHAQKDDPAPIMQEVHTQMTRIFIRKTGPQRWQNGRVARCNPYGLGRIWIELDSYFMGGHTCTVVVSANGTTPTQYAPVPEGKAAEKVPINAVWFPSGNAVALIYAKDVPDVVLSWDNGALASAADSAQAQFINPKQQPMTVDDWTALKLDGKDAYLIKLAVERAKRQLQRRFILWPSGKLRSEWHVYESDDGTYVCEGNFALWFESGEPNEKGIYKDGTPDGRIQEWDNKGGVVTDGIWANGKPLTGLCRDLSDGKNIKQFKDGIAVTESEKKP